ncbi:MAG TPA: hypothetical protein VF006_23480 [Longimicrobium sp.]
MMRTDAATRHVVERCPRCGVEHDLSADTTCEACDTPLRAWCRVHGHETGWLDGPACGRCAEDAAAARRAPARPTIPCPAPSMPSTLPAASSLAPGVARRAEVPAHATTPPEPLGPAQHLTVMVLMMLMWAGGGTLAGVVAGFLFVLSGRGTLPDTALWFALGGVLAGMLLGGWTCLRYLNGLRAPRER